MNDERELDQKKLNMIKLRILSEERKNIKTQDKTPIQMADIVRSIIADEVNKSY